MTNTRKTFLSCSKPETLEEQTAKRITKLIGIGFALHCILGIEKKARKPKTNPENLHNSTQ